MADETDFQIEQDGEYTRFRMNVQRGEGVDRRGDVSVEMIREREPASTAKIKFEDGEQKTLVDNETFAEFVFETRRAVKLLEDRLGIEDGE